MKSENFFNANLKINRVALFFIPFFTTFITALPLFSQENWQLIKNKNGIKVYTKEAEGSPFRSFLAKTTLPATIEEVTTVLRDGDRYVDWFAYTERSKLLSKIGSNQYVYIETDFPWPYSNEDMVYQMSFIKISDTKTKIILTGLNNYIPEKQGIKRMKKAHGSIVLTSLGSSTEIVYFFHSEPSGDIPVALANKSMGELPYRSLQSLQKIVSKI